MFTLHIILLLAAVSSSAIAGPLRQKDFHQAANASSISTSIGSTTSGTSAAAADEGPGLPKASFLPHTRTSPTTTTDTATPGLSVIPVEPTVITQTGSNSGSLMTSFVAVPPTSSPLQETQRRRPATFAPPKNSTAARARPSPSSTQTLRHPARLSSTANPTAPRFPAGSPSSGFANPTSQSRVRAPRPTKLPGTSPSPSTSRQTLHSVPNTRRPQFLSTGPITRLRQPSQTESAPFPTATSPAQRKRPLGTAPVSPLPNPKRPALTRNSTSIPTIIIKTRTSFFTLPPAADTPSTPLFSAPPASTLPLTSAFPTNTLSTPLFSVPPASTSPVPTVTPPSPTASSTGPPPSTQAPATSPTPTPIPSPDPTTVITPTPTIPETQPPPSTLKTMVFTVSTVLTITTQVPVSNTGADNAAAVTLTVADAANPDVTLTTVMPVTADNAAPSSTTTSGPLSFIIVPTADAFEVGEADLNGFAYERERRRILSRDWVV